MSARKRIEEIRAREQAATHGEWCICGFGFHIGPQFDWGLHTHQCCAPMKYEDRVFVANAKQDIPFLLARLARAEELLREYEDDEDIGAFLDDDE